MNGSVMNGRPLSAGVTFGLGMISAQHDPRDHRSDADIYADLLDLCAVAEADGLDAVWLSEHHFVDDGYMPSLLPTAAAIAARTTRIAVATGVIVAPLHEPLRLAEDAATVDLISGGRLVLGLGAGYRAEEFAGFGRSGTELGAALDTTIDVLRAGWSGSPVRLGERPPVLVTPRPAAADGPPIWIGARTPPGIRRTAQRADGLLAARVDPGALAAQVGRLDDELTAAGRERDQVAVGVHCPVFAWTSAAEAWRLVEPPLHYSEWKYADMVGQPYGTRPDGAGAPSTPPALTDPTRAKLRVGALVGTVAEVADGIAAYAAAAGRHPFHFIARLYWPGLDPALTREALAVFCRQVVPEVRARLAPV
jgi:alkanesulfonate monooxygenase SsuD/methylene tetrahydromethanopterin reductase-like flavin-dependent oxidoreductase (luciferase family)